MRDINENLFETIYDGMVGPVRLYIRYCPLALPGEGVYYGEIWSERLLSERRIKDALCDIFETSESQVNCNIISEWSQ